jgi:hypothetical protein
MGKDGNIADLSLPAGWVNDLFSGRALPDYNKEYPEFPKKKYRYSDYPQTFEGVAIACADAARSDSYLSNAQTFSGKISDDDMVVLVIVSFLDLMRGNPVSISEYQYPWSKSGEKIAGQGITKLKLYMEWMKEAAKAANEGEMAGF